MRVAGSLTLGTVNPTQLIKALQRGGNPTMLGRAIGELGRIFKTIHSNDAKVDPNYIIVVKNVNLLRLSVPLLHKPHFINEGIIT